MTIYKQGIADVPAVLSSKCIRHLRDMATASGDVSYTGYGFEPKALIIFSAIDATSVRCWGISNSALDERCINEFGDGTKSHVNEKIVSTGADLSNYQHAIVKSMDADGFTLTWTKVGSPTGDLYLHVLALK